MSTTRRDFLDRLATSTVALGGLSLAMGLLPDELTAAPLPSAAQGGFDTSWPDKLTGRVRAVFDVAELDSGLGVWRASIWEQQYQGVLNVPKSDLSTALVIRHNAIGLAMTQEFWDRYELGTVVRATHPVTREATTKNPVLLGTADGLPDALAGYSLPNFIARGGVALACALALQSMFRVVNQKDGVDANEARRRVMSALVPGVIVQPSGMFAVLRAQEVKQAMYMRAA